MAALIQRVASQALQTFTKTSSASAFHENLQQLRKLVHRLTAEDVNFDPGLVENTDHPGGELSGTGRERAAAPVTYLNLFEDQVLTIGIFVLKPGARLPLHDHPGMFGVIKVIHGAAEVHSYSEAKGRPIPEVISQHWQLADEPPSVRAVPPSVRAVDRLSPALVTSDCPPCILSPDEGNFHEIRSSEGPMAFLDILAPPYDAETGARECNYYRKFTLQAMLEATTSGEGSNGHVHCSTSDFGNDCHHQHTTDKQGTADGDCYLVRIPQPNDFWCDTAEYTGPEINPYITKSCCTHV